MTLASRNRRLRDLEDLIAKNERLLKEVREQRDVTVDPVERARYEISIQRLDGSRGEYYQEAEKVLNEVKQSLLSFYSSYYPDLQPKISYTVKQLNQGQLVLLQEILNALDTHQLLESEIYQIWTNDLQAAALALPSTQIPVAEITQNSRSDIKQRLILSIPFVIGAYEVEWEISSEFNLIDGLRKVSEAVRSKLSRK